MCILQAILAQLEKIFTFLLFVLKKIYVSTQIYIKIQYAFCSKGKGKIDERKSRGEEMYKLVLNCTVENFNDQINTVRLAEKIKGMYKNKKNKNNIQFTIFFCLFDPTGLPSVFLTWGCGVT
ncbi:hypothetical protein BpHYR1_019322, partial [Brachionus plicatilis]